MLATEGKYARNFAPGLSANFQRCRPIINLQMFYIKWRRLGRLQEPSLNHVFGSEKPKLVYGRFRIDFGPDLSLKLKDNICCGEVAGFVFVMEFGVWFNFNYSTGKILWTHMFW